MIVDDQLAGRFGMRGGGLGSLNRGPCNGLSPVATLGAETCAAFTEARTVAEAPALILGAVDWAAALVLWIVISVMYSRHQSETLVIV